MMPLQCNYRDGVMGLPLDRNKGMQLFIRAGKLSYATAQFYR